MSEIKYDTKECPLYIGNTCHALDKAYRVGKVDAIDELKMLFKLSMSEKPNRTINECEAMIIFRNLEKQIKEKKNE